MLLGRTDRTLRGSATAPGMPWSVWRNQLWLWVSPRCLSRVLLTSGCALCLAMQDQSAALRSAPSSAVCAAELCPAASSALGVLEFSRALFHLWAFPESQNRLQGTSRDGLVESPAPSKVSHSRVLRAILAGLEYPQSMEAP